MPYVHFLKLHVHCLIINWFEEAPIQLTMHCHGSTNYIINDILEIFRIHNLTIIIYE